MDERHAATPRALNVSLAVSVAANSASGWDDPALPDDFASIGRLLGVGPAGARDRVVKVAVPRCRGLGVYGVPAAAALLPAVTEQRKTKVPLPGRSNPAGFWHP